MNTCFVLLNTNDTGSLFGSTGNAIGEIIRFVLVFVAVLFLAYYVTRVIGTSKRGGFKRGTNIRMLEGAKAGPQGAVQIVRVGTKYFLLGITKENITFLTEISESDIDISLYEQATAPVVPFSKVLNRFYKPRAKQEDAEEDADDANQ